ncbi:MAG: hemerythrin domain-containing protein [Myxococcota bacterium]|nr:hemerythrin domain-containing protein [Myxococcota bacterium]
MKATELLKQQHREVARLFQAIEDTEDRAEKKSYFLQLASNLVAHDAIERKIFYPACEQELGLEELLGSALVEHGVIEFSLYQANQALGEDDFDYKVTVLKELVEHHVKEEETEFFPKVEQALGSEMLDALGDELDEAFQKEREGDYLRPLFENLRQVLAGAVKTTPLDASLDRRVLAKTNSPARRPQKRKKSA